eukprot:5154166-Alexandrium_andersonii.AAC.1
MPPRDVVRYRDGRNARRRGRPLTPARASRRRFRRKFLEFSGVRRKMMRKELGADGHEPVSEAQTI